MGLLAPAALGLAALLAPVVAMYFFRQQRERIVLPAIALWTRYVRERSQASRLHKFRGDPLLWLQLALMAALIAALARPYWRGRFAPGQTTVLILDASASMQTVENGRTRFAIAKQEAGGLLGALGGSDRAMLVAAGPRPWVVQSLTDDGRALRRALDDLACTDGPGNIATAVRVAAQVAGPGTTPQIHVWTDGAGAALDAIGDVRVPVEWHAAGAESENVGIAALSVRRRPDSPVDLEVFGSVVNLGRAPQSVAVALSLDDALLQFHRFTLPPGAEQVFTEPLLAGRAGVIELKVDAGDALAVDDAARLVLGEHGVLRVLLVTSGNSVLDKALSLVPGVELIRTTPGRVDFGGANADMAVLDRWAPAEWPPMPTLVIGPPPGAPFANAVVRRAPTIATWRRDHPLLRHLTFADLHVNGALVQPAARGVTHLVSADTGGIVWLEHAGGARRVVVGFGLDQSDWILRPSFPLFLANVLDSVREETGGGLASAARVGETLAARPPASVGEVTVRDPEGETRTIATLAGTALVDATWQAGLYRFDADGWSDVRAVNLLDVEESRIQPAPPPEASDAEALRAGLGGTREFWPWLILLGLLLSLGEWAVYHRRTL